MFESIFTAAREYWRGLTFLQRLGLKALVGAAAIALLVAAAPKLAAVAVGGMLASVGALLLRWAWAE